MNLIKPPLGRKPIYTGQPPVLDLAFLRDGDYNNYANLNPEEVATNNGATWVAGENGPALSFDGVNDYVDLGNKPMFVGMPAMTIITAGTCNNIAAAYRTYGGKLWSVPSSYAIRQTNTGVLQFLLQTTGSLLSVDTSTAGIIVNDGIRKVIVARYDGAEMSLYIDGARVQGASATKAITGNVNTSTEELTIGALRDGASKAGYFAGTIEYFNIYNRALTAQEIKDQYENPWQDWQQDNTLLFASQGTPVTGVTPTQYYKQFLQGVA